MIKRAEGCQRLTGSGLPEEKICLLVKLLAFREGYFFSWILQIRLYHGRNVEWKPSDQINWPYITGHIKNENHSLLRWHGLHLCLDDITTADFFSIISQYENAFRMTLKLLGRGNEIVILTATRLEKYASAYMAESCIAFSQIHCRRYCPVVPTSTTKSTFCSGLLTRDTLAVMHSLGEKQRHTCSERRQGLVLSP